MAQDTLTAKELSAPSLPQGSPSHLEHLLDELTESLDLDAPSTSYRVLKRTLHFLMGFFADLAASLSSVFGELDFEDPAQPDAKNAEDVLRKGIEFLISDAPQDLPEVKVFLNVFFDDQTARNFTKMMAIGGRPRRGVAQFSKFVTSKQVPVRKKCVQEVRRYLPYLKDWLDAAAVFFDQTRILSERTGLDGQQKVILQVAKQELTAGSRLQLGNCPLCTPDKEIDVPDSLYDRPVYFFVPQRAPKLFVEILDRLDAAMKEGDPVAGCLELRNSLEFLTRYFAGVSSKVCEDLGVLTEEGQDLAENSQSVSASERLLNLCLKTLKNQPDSLAAKSLMGVFYRRNEMFEYIPRWHTEILALQGQLSAWCQLEPGYGEMEDPEACKLEFEKHVPTLRDWLTSLGSYLQSTEHFFEEIQPEGNVDFSVRIGDRFIEISEPGYQLWLNNPRPEGELALASGEGAPKPLIREPLDIPDGCPQVLSNILQRCDIYLRLGDPVEACVSLRDAMDYLTRYFAGLAAAAFRELGTLPEEAERMAQSSLSVHECEKLLILSLGSIGRESSEQLGTAVKSVFYYQEDFSEEDRPTGAHARILEMDADPSTRMQNLAEFCSLKAGEGVLSNPARSKREIERFLPMLRDWLAMGEPFFSKCEHFEEPPGEDGKTELVVKFEDFYLEMVEPDYIFYIRPGCDEVPDIEAPELPPPDLVLEDELLEEPVKRKERAEDRPFLASRVEYIGQRENSQGVVCKAGYIIITNQGGGTLSGTAGSTHPALEVTPKRFRGNKVQLSYWLDEDELPDTFEAFILLRTPEEQRTVSVYEMREKDERARLVTPGIAIQRLAMPLIASFLFFCGMFYLGNQFIHDRLVEDIGPLYATMNLMENAPESRAKGLGIAQGLGYLWLLMAGLIPIWVGKTYLKLPHGTRAVVEDHMKRVLLIPSIIAVVLSGIAWWFFPLVTDNDFREMQVLRMLPWFFGINLLSATYMDLSLKEKLDDWVHDRIVRRYIIPPCFFFAFLMVVQLGLQS